MKKIFYNKIIKLSASKFKKYNKEKLLNLILKGNIIIVKKAVNQKKLLQICGHINNKKLKISISAKMYEGIKNIFYEASAKIDKVKVNKKYLVSNRSWYFFPWNKDRTNLVKLIQPIFNHVINLNGYDPKLILKNTPKDGIIQRFHLINYPYGSGFISRHVDPTKIVKVTAGIYITEYGKDYNSGGFYVLDKKKKKKNIDKYIKSSDMVLFYASMPHGVDSITADKKQEKNKSIVGRWFLNLTLVASHHVKKRIVSVGY
tara:strand:- start:151 stop:927 length:777 start_codon:yes stop_codon:yes gene_type:complete